MYDDASPWYRPEWTAEDERKARRKEIALDAAPRDFDAPEVDWLSAWSPDAPLSSNGPAEFGARRLPRDVAVLKRFVQPTVPGYQNMIILDIDQADAASLVKSHAYDYDAGHPKHIPEPSFIAQNPGSTHAHAGWYFDGHVGTKKGAAFAQHVAGRIGAVVGADPAYTQGLMRNPLHIPHMTHWLSSSRPTLSELDDQIHSSVRAQRRITTVRALGAAADEDLIEVYGRNVGTFESVRKIVYSDWWSHRNAGYAAWIEHVRCVAFERHRYLVPDPASQLSAAELTGVARSIAKWVWSRFSVEAFKEVQRKRGLLSGIARRDPYLQKCRDVLSMQAAGKTRAEIAEHYGNKPSSGKSLIQRARRELGTEWLIDTMADVIEVDFSTGEIEFALAS